MADSNIVNYPEHTVWLKQENGSSIKLGQDQRSGTQKRKMRGRCRCDNHEMHPDHKNPNHSCCPLNKLNVNAGGEHGAAQRVANLEKQLADLKKRYLASECQLANAIEQISEQNRTIEELYNESEKHRDSAKLLSKWIRKRMKKYGTVGPVAEVVSLQLTKNELINMVTEAVSTSVAASVDMNRDVIDLTGDE